MQKIEIRRKKRRKNVWLYLGVYKYIKIWYNKKVGKLTTNKSTTIVEVIHDADKLPDSNYVIEKVIEDNRRGRKKLNNK